jgi:feruloyl esterase
MSGIPYGCATDVSSATTCQRGVTKTAAQWGDLARAADPAFTGPYPRLQIWQGTADTTVDPSNATALVDQWTNIHGAASPPDTTDTISTATRTRYAAGAVELYLVSGMGHAIATGADDLGTCPAGAGAYFADEAICSTLRAAEFFGLDAGSGGSDGEQPPEMTKSDGGCNVGGTPGWALALLLVRRRRR